ncbi:DUF6431 domain-containing protein [Desulfotomaculum defluvii]
MINLQLIFYTEDTPLDYFNAGKTYSFPRPETCLHPDCRIPIPPRPYGYYIRNVISINFNERIMIRRYLCPRCGHTFSYLPSFCLPYYQYTLALIWANLICQVFNIVSFLKSLMASVDWQRQHLQFYRRRFKSNLNFIQVVLRHLMPEVKLPDEIEEKEKAKRVLNIAISGFNTIQAFSTRFFSQCNSSFMAHL